MSLSISKKQRKSYMLCGPPWRRNCLWQRKRQAGFMVLDWNMVFCLPFGNETTEEQITSSCSLSGQALDKKSLQGLLRNQSFTDVRFVLTSAIGNPISWFSPALDSSPSCPVVSLAAWWHCFTLSITRGKYISNTLCANPIPQEM